MDQEDTTKQPVQPEEISSDQLIPITRIGIETELSRYPVHNLAKKGRVNIQIIRKLPNGEVDLKWEVSYSERHGQARQFAYKLDTIIINRRIDEQSRPMPDIIRLGSLRDIAEELELDGSGDSTNRVKKALHQNAGAYITAKIKYRTHSNTEKTLEAGFTRYSVIFTGEKLPDGRDADAVYLVLNKPYLQVLNDAPIRPLNYEYLKSLKPAPQRFYEIISSRVYAALKNRNPFARILYSDFCTYSALTRHLDHENFRVQMSKILRPHLKSGYIAKAQYEQTTDQQGNADWMMIYSPGPRARTEYMTFARKSKQEGIRAELAAHYEAGENESPAAEFALLQPRKPTVPHPPEIVEMMNRGITETRAKKLFSQSKPGQQILDQVEWGDHLIKREPGKYKNPGGFYVVLISENVLPPATFETSRQHRAREQAQAASQLEKLQAMQLEDEYDAYKSNQVEEFMKTRLTEAELSAITEQKRTQIASTFKNFHLMTPEARNSLLWGAVKAEVRPRVQFVSLEEFARSRSSQPSLFARVPAMSQEQGSGEVATEPQTLKPLQAQNLPQGASSTPGSVSFPTPAVSVPYKAEFRATEQSSKTTRKPKAAAEQGTGSTDRPDMLARYRDYCREAAVRAIDSLDMFERGRRLKAARQFLLKEHPEQERFQHLISEGQYDEFTQHAQTHLIEVTLGSLNVPSFDEWKQRF